jgi:hypothetical protein
MTHDASAAGERDNDTGIPHPPRVIVVGPAISHVTETPADVADPISQRVTTQAGDPAATIDTTTVPTAEQVQRLIDKVAAEETGGLGTIPDTLNPMLNSLVALAAAVRVLGIYFSGDTAHGDLDADLNWLRKRFRQAVETVATTGDPEAVGAEGTGAGEVERPPGRVVVPGDRPGDPAAMGVPRHVTGRGVLMPLPPPAETLVDLEAAYLAGDTTVQELATVTGYPRKRADRAKAVDLRMTRTIERRISMGQVERAHLFELRLSWPLVSGASSLTDDQRYVEMLIEALLARVRGDSGDHTHAGLFRSVAQWEDGPTGASGSPDVVRDDPMQALAQQTPVLTATVTYGATELLTLG